MSKAGPVAQRSSSGIAHAPRSGRNPAGVIGSDGQTPRRQLALVAFGCPTPPRSTRSCGCTRSSNPGSAGVLQNAHKAHRLRQGAAAAAVKMELALLHRAFVLALKANRVERVPPLPTVEVDNARSGFCSPEEIEKVIAQLPEHVAPVVRLLYLTGMRKGEALNLRWSRVDFDAQVIGL